MRVPDIVPQRRAMSTPAVEVSNACKSYKKGTQVLSSLCMRVERGTIYGLLGASGCGKTTLLSCILGLQELNGGEVKVFGAKPGTRESGIPGKAVGYMPQEIALFDIFTVGEVLSFFGRIYEMRSGVVKARAEVLIELLHLPPSSHFIKNLSGGQKRRLSLAVAIFHQPELLILDEPTVGVDPLLRECIWNYLREIVEVNKTTIIITTHYIEEARHSHRIGLMRNGKLLTEGNPETLLKEYDSDLLEDLVLKLCHGDQSQMSNHDLSTELAEAFVDDIEEIVGLKYQRRNTGASIYSNHHDQVESLRKLRSASEELAKRKSLRRRVRKVMRREYDKTSSLLKKNFLQHFRQPTFVFIQLFIPVLQIILFNLIMGTEPYGLKVGVVNKDIPTNGTQTFLDYCQNSYTPTCFGPSLSCSYFEMFEKGQVTWVPKESEDTALESVSLGQTVGFISIPPGFSKQMQERMLLKQFASNETLDGSKIIIRMDFSNQLNSGYLIREFHEQYLLFVQTLVRGCGQDPALVTLPLKYNAVYGTVDGRWAEFYQPAFVLWIIFLLPTTAGLFYVSDVKAGTMDRTVVAGVKFRHLLISLLICEGCMVVLQLVLCFLVLFLGFNFQVNGSLVLCFFICFLMGMVGVTLGVTVGTVCKDQEMEVVMTVNTIFMITLSASGGVWPIETIVRWYRVLSYLVPVTIPMQSLRAVVNQGWGLDHPIVFQGVAYMFTWIGVCCIVSTALHKLRHY